jgi:hypothetical protein
MPLGLWKSVSTRVIVQRLSESLNRVRPFPSRPVSATRPLRARERVLCIQTYQYIMRFDTIPPLPKPLPHTLIARVRVADNQDHAEWERSDRSGPHPPHIRRDRSLQEFGLLRQFGHRDGATDPAVSRFKCLIQSTAAFVHRSNNSWSIRVDSIRTFTPTRCPGRLSSRNSFGLNARHKADGLSSFWLEPLEAQRRRRR